MESYLYRSAYEYLWLFCVHLFYCCRCSLFVFPPSRADFLKNPSNSRKCARFFVVWQVSNGSLLAEWSGTCSQSVFIQTRHPVRVSVSGVDIQQQASKHSAAAVSRLRCLIDLLPLRFFARSESSLHGMKSVCNKFNWNVPPRIGARTSLLSHLQIHLRAPRIWCNIFIMIENGSREPSHVDLSAAK